MSGGVVYQDGAFREVDPQPNPLYLAGLARTVCQCLLEFLPTGQAQLVYGVEVQAPVRQLMFSLLFTGLALWLGVKLFERKEIR